MAGGGPTFLGPVVGYDFMSTYVFVLLLTLAAGALIYVINEIFGVGRRMSSSVALGWGVLLGFLAVRAPIVSAGDRSWARRC
jgi:ZIP family zinc transporter